MMGQSRSGAGGDPMQRAVERKMDMQQKINLDRMHNEMLRPKRPQIVGSDG